MYQRLVSYCLVASFSVGLLGCGGGGPQIVPVTGIVNYKGQPIGSVNVMFTPANLKGQIAEGTTDVNGQFKLQTMEPGDGAIPGDYKVSFKFVSEIIPDMPGFAGGVKPEPSPIPAKYADDNTSGFTATVESSDNEFKFDLE